MTKNNFFDIVNFYLDNELNEIYSKQPINRLNSSTPPDLNIISPPSPTETFLPIKTSNNNISTAMAISKLAQKNQNLTISGEVFDSDKFMPINDIIEKAKNLAQNAKNITELKNIVENFDGCNLKKMATNTVFADGNPNSKIMVIGEAPGNNEDIEGIPFCGDSGEMLSGMLQGINLSRQNDYYITNVIFWRPPGNRRPTDEELSICRPFVQRHIQLFNPKLIILVGATAMNAMIDAKETISNIRGKFLKIKPDYLDHEVIFLTIFHPSFLMRQPQKKKIAWLDMQKINELIDNNYEI